MKNINLRLSNLFKKIKSYSRDVRPCNF